MSAIIDSDDNKVLLYGDRLKLLRESKNISQQALADALGSDVAKIKQMEHGVTLCDSGRVAEIREILDADFLPLLDSEIPAFRERLYIWRDMIRNRKLDEAKELQSKIAGIVDLDVEVGLISLYSMFEITLLIVQGDFAKATLKLDDTDKALMDTESRYYYFRNKGTISTLNENFEDALMLFSQALEIGKSDEWILKDDDSIYYNIALCYYNLHLPHHALGFLHESGKMYTTDRVTPFGWHIDSAIAVNYIRTNQLTEAARILERCLVFAEASGDKTLIAITLHNYGFMHQMADNWLLAANYYGKSSSICEQGSDLHLENLYQESRCCMELGDYSKSVRLIESAKAHFSREINHMLSDTSTAQFAMLFETLGHLLNVILECEGDAETEIVGHSAAFIEVTAIPYSINIYKYTHVLDYCKVLGKYYEKANAFEKSLAINKIAMEIYKKMLYYRRN